MDSNSKIFLAGHGGLVGSAIYRKLKEQGYKNIILAHREVDLRYYDRVNSFIEEFKPEYVICAAAKVGGIIGNRDYKADIIWDNLMIQSNLIDLSWDWEIPRRYRARQARGRPPKQWPRRRGQRAAGCARARYGRPQRPGMPLPWYR